MTSDDFVIFLSIILVLGIGMLYFSYVANRAASVGFIRHVQTGLGNAWLQSLILYGLAILLFAGGIFFMNVAYQSEGPKPIKLILLDIDGVLNHNKAKERIDTYLYDPACVTNMNKLIKAHGAKIVVCSAWRIGQSIESMQGILDSIGLESQVIGITPDLMGNHTRDDEITAWLQNFDNWNQVVSMVLIDDDPSERFEHIQVKPSWDEMGFIFDHVRKADSILSAGLPENFDIGKVSICKLEASGEISFGGQHIQKKRLDL